PRRPAPPPDVAALPLDVAPRSLVTWCPVGRAVPAVARLHLQGPSPPVNLVAERRLLPASRSNHAQQCCRWRVGRCRCRARVAAGGALVGAGVVAESLQVASPGVAAGGRSGSGDL